MLELISYKTEKGLYYANKKISYTDNRESVNYKVNGKPYKNVRNCEITIV